jgi:hypothetical protein
MTAFLPIQMESYGPETLWLKWVADYSFVLDFSTFSS